MLAVFVGGCGGGGGSTSSGGAGGTGTGGSGGSATGGQGAGGKGGAATGGATGSGGTGAGGVTGTGGITGTGGAGAGGVSGRGGTAGMGSGGTGGMTSSTGGSGTGGLAGTGGAMSNGTFYVSPSGTGSSCTSAAPCSITQAQTVVRGAAVAMNGDLVVELADGTYRLAAPLVFTAADSGTNGHTITWQAATRRSPGALRRQADHRVDRQRFEQEHLEGVGAQLPSRRASCTSTARSPPARDLPRSAART